MPEFTSHERIHQALRPIGDRLAGGDAARRRVRLDRALDDAGKLKASALTGVQLIVLGGDANQTSRNTASTTVFTEALKLTDNLPDERSRWVVQVDADLRATVSDSTNADVELLVNGQVVDSLDRSATASATAPFFLFGLLAGADAIPGGQPIEFILRFKSDTGGTVTVGMQRLRYFCFRET